MTGNSRVHHRVPPERVTTLKPQKLGRHCHKIPQHIREITAKHPRPIGDYFLRNYRINLELVKVHVQEQISRAPDCIYRSRLGKLGFAIDRSLLNEAIECYYGGAILISENEPPISASEQRMRERLGKDIVDVFMRTMLSGESIGELAAHQSDYEEIVWEYVAQFEYLSHVTGARASIFIHLDGDLVDALTAHLTRPGSQARPVGDPLESIRQLPVRLNCVIAAAQIPLEQVLALQLNDVLLIRPLDRYEVRINQQKLFRGTIFEEDGALFLTSLESTTSP